jgi:hypothetical protein
LAVAYQIVHFRKMVCNATPTISLTPTKWWQTKTAAVKNPKGISSFSPALTRSGYAG